MSPEPVQRSRITVRSLNALDLSMCQAHSLTHRQSLVYFEALRAQRPARDRVHRVPVQYVTSSGRSASVNSTTRSTNAGGKGGRPGFWSCHVRARPSLHTWTSPASARRRAWRPRRMISAVPQRSAVARMIFARQTCFCGLFRSATIAANRPRCTALTSTLSPSRMPHHGTQRDDWPSYDRVRTLVDCL
jgi:hypothetical protein